MNSLEQVTAAVAAELAVEGIPGDVVMKVVVAAAVKIRAGAYAEAAAVAFDDAETCPEGCGTAFCSTMNRRVGEWLTLLAAAENASTTNTDDRLPLSMFAAWLASGRRGVSSEAIVAQLTGEAVGRHPAAGPSWGDHPYDSGDFGRCRGLLAQYPHIRPVFDELMPKRSPQWAALVHRWDDIDSLYAADIDAGLPGSRAATQLISDLLDAAKDAS